MQVIKHMLKGSIKTVLVLIAIMLFVMSGCGGSGGGGSSGGADDPGTDQSDSDTDGGTGGGSGDGSGGSGQSTELPSVTIESAQNITSANQHAYYVLGTCSENGLPVIITIAAIEASTTCLANSWIIESLDLSSLEDSSDLEITADHADEANNNASQASVSIFKNTTTPVVTINQVDPITNANVSDYKINGLCSENGEAVIVAIEGMSFEPNCLYGTWSTGYVDVTAIPDSPAVDITADHYNASGDAAVPATATVQKNLALPTVTISSAPDITLTNQSNYTISGTCSEQDQTVDINVELLNWSPTCSSETWILSALDLSTLEDDPEISVTADHADVSGDAAIQAVKIISKATTTPSVSDLSLVYTLAREADIIWTLEDPGGFSIDDYIVQYRIAGTGVWLLFSDGQSAETSTTVTGLNPATEYEFRVALVYDGSEQSQWSNTLEAETKPEDPLFGKYKAMNVGGADESSVLAFEDNTTVTLNGGELVILNKGETHVFASEPFDVIDADKPIFTSGRLGPNDAGRFGANMVWIPATWAARSFSFNATRYNPQRVEVYPIESGTITVKTGTTVLDSADITAGEGATLEWSTYGSFQVSSTGMVLLYHYSSGSGSYVDPKPLLPSAKKIIGFPSRSMRLTAIQDNTNYTAVHSNSVTSIDSLNKPEVIRIDPEGSDVTLYRSDSLLITADKEVSGASYADLNGYAASVFLPTPLMKKTYGLNADADYVAFASLKPGLIKVLDSNDQIIAIGSLNRSGVLLNSPYKARFENLPAGTRFFSTVPMAAWYQPSGYTGSMRYDETILYGTDMEDPTAEFTVPENPVTCLTLKTETPELGDGIYEIDPDGDGGELPYFAYCDMTTQGGGWTMVIRYDRDLAETGNYSLPPGAGRSAINPDDMLTLEATSNLAASLDIRPFIKAGATHFMHVTTASNDINYTYTYFSDIDLVTRMYPDSIFDASMDTNSGEGVQGTAVDWSETYSNQWYESDFSLMTNSQTTGSVQNSHRSISGGEGAAMFTNGNREGAVFCSGVATSGSVEGHSNPKVQWGFVGKDGTTQSYGGATHVGTYCNTSLNECEPASQMNFMFVR